MVRVSSRIVSNVAATLSVVCGVLVGSVTSTVVVNSVVVNGVLLGSLLVSRSAQAQDVLPYDNGIFTYHTTPRYRESESHPLRVLGYALHPIGWVAREGIFRPLSYLMGSTETMRSIFGYREPYDFRTPECFSADDSVPDCRSILPFNYDAGTPGAAGGGSVDGEGVSAMNGGDHQVYFPDVNFDFNKHALNTLGEGRVHQIAQMLKGGGSVHFVLQGHADFIGNEQYNEKLGMNRAEAVRAELVNLGVPADRLSTVSFGESQPVLSDQTDWARAVNRRVEVHADAGAAAAPAHASAE